MRTPRERRQQANAANRSLTSPTETAPRRRSSRCGFRSRSRR